MNGHGAESCSHSLPQLRAFYFEMERRGVELYDIVPSALAGAAARGEIDAGPMPLVDCFHLDERFRFLSGFCLATVHRASSVALHSKRPIHELTGASIGIPDEAATSALLVKVLLTLKHDVQPAAYVPFGETNDAFLLIGSEGLRQRHGVWDYPIPMTWERNGLSGRACLCLRALGCPPSVGSQRGDRLGRRALHWDARLGRWPISCR